MKLFGGRLEITCQKNHDLLIYVRVWNFLFDFVWLGGKWQKLD